jgi:hypothetical protein
MPVARRRGDAGGWRRLLSKRFQTSAAELSGGVQHEMRSFSGSGSIAFL